ncbi:toxin-activating lysine-acyltransferase [Vibrio cholerae]|uniref:RTX toxin-activating lysine-acyltransferase n=1 Tax=Vibrio cholerae TaxID=666 RepID=A0A6B3LP65_VIBCL|nr:toxin-activating lysine-acyltransferase [Vibrio cholerae]EGQ9967402.1 toxin-activating lysine-acyltransferase [Vibrio cholerae]EGR2107509.1 toxin-activating lysine-acyltransferase [Vibrio cholerae]EJL6593459.1 toxin-activating lysine-acyltransferase [Vibrio cholerae]EJO4035324.1 toxin-activating lysine-acyltransferase [Vibrio cholerae]ELJ8793256.1 toxin-activating lysine-acyltransferase [Vibrio cholerae]
MNFNDDVPPIHEWNSIILESSKRKIFYIERQALLGDLTYILATNQERRKLSVGSFYHWFINAIKHEQVHLLQDEFSRYATGYLIWAWVSDKTLDQYLTDPTFVPHPSQWNEGKNLIFFDICLPNKKLSTKRKLFKIKNKLKASGVSRIFYREPGKEEPIYCW